jgi:hypothetical protein
MVGVKVNGITFEGGLLGGDFKEENRAGLGPALISDYAWLIVIKTIGRRFVLL